MWTRKYCPTVFSTVSMCSVNLSCCSNMIPDTSISSLSVIPLSAIDASELAPDKSPRFFTLILSKLRSSSMTCLTGCMRKLTMSQRTHLGRSTAGCTILYLIKEMKPKIQHLLHVPVITHQLLCKLITHITFPLQQFLSKLLFLMHYIQIYCYSTHFCNPEKYKDLSLTQCFEEEISWPLESKVHDPFNSMLR